MGQDITDRRLSIKRGKLVEVGTPAATGARKDARSAERRIFGQLACNQNGNGGVYA
jgi:hypothetical protein